MGTGEVVGGTPMVCRWVGALVGVMAKLLTVGAEGEKTEAQFALGSEVGLEG